MIDDDSNVKASFSSRVGSALLAGSCYSGLVLPVAKSAALVLGSPRSVTRKSSGWYLEFLRLKKVGFKKVVGALIIRRRLQLVSLHATTLR